MQVIKESSSQFPLLHSAMNQITSAVQLLYEKHPYPNYPLLAKPRWQEGWLTSSSFNAALAGSLSGETVKALHKTILIAGCGEILPAIICANEPYANQIEAVELSGHSIKRAMFRCASELYRLKFRHAEMIDFLQQGMRKYDHIDCYGVLHHLANPVSSLEALYLAMNPGGTARIMVYNSAARSWIHQWQLVFKNLKLTTSHSDINACANILYTAGQLNTNLGTLLAQMGPSIFRNKARFADTFLHPREARISAEQWFDGLRKSGFHLIGLFDRYEECDDMENPLWGINQDDIKFRIVAGKFSNNIEILVQKPGGIKFSHPKQKSIRFTGLSTPPKAWSNTMETLSISKITMYSLWRKHHKYLAGKQGELPAKLLSEIPQAALQRLARLGAILPQQLGHDQRSIAKGAMKSPPTISQNIQCTSTKEIDSFIEETCSIHSVPLKYRAAVSLRLRQAIFSG